MEGVPRVGRHQAYFLKVVSEKLEQSNNKTLVIDASCRETEKQIDEH